MEDKTLYVVSGFMRTGTSMMMKALEAGGLDAAYQQSREEMRRRFADDQYDPNLGGLYELEREDYRKPDFPRGWEGKLIKCLSRGPAQMMPMPDGIRVVFMRRDTEEISQSYMAFFGRRLNPQLEGVLQDRMDAIVERIQNRKDVLSLDVFWFRDVVGAPREYFEQLRKHSWPIDVDAAVGVVDPSLCRYKREELTEGIL